MSAPRLTAEYEAYLAEFGERFKPMTAAEYANSKKWKSDRERKLATLPRATELSRWSGTCTAEAVVRGNIASCNLMKDHTGDHVHLDVIYEHGDQYEYLWTWAQ